MARVFTAFAILFAAACAAPPPPPTAPEWKLTEEWRVGGDADGPHAFDSDLGFARLPNGGFVHYNYNAKQLYFLDSLGNSVRSVGRYGHGPGEFDVANGLTVATDGTVIVSDLTNGFLLYSEAGDFLKRVLPLTPRLETGGRWQATALSDGRVMEIVEGRDAKATSPLRLLWSAGLLDADTLPSCLVPGSSSATFISLKDASGAIMSNIPLRYVRPDQPVVIDPHGFVWEAPDLSLNAIVRHRPDSCDIDAAVLLSGSRAKLTANDREIISSAVKAEAQRWHTVPEPLSDIPAVHSWYRGLYVDTQGNLWVERVLENGALHWQVYSASGALMAEVAGAGFPSSPIMTDSHVYGFVQDQDGVQYLAGFRIDKVSVRP
jgi:hypothetical protein